jgi:hypothetical protein
MKSVTKTIPASELPTEWQAEGQFAPTDRVTVTVEQENGALTALREGLDEAAASLDRGEGRTLTAEDLKDIKKRGRERLAQSR